MPRLLGTREAVQALLNEINNTNVTVDFTENQGACDEIIKRLAENTNVKNITLHNVKENPKQHLQRALNLRETNHLTVTFTSL